MTDEEIAYAGIAEQAELVRAGRVSPRELSELFLGRIERVDPLNSFRVVMADEALAAAGEASRDLPLAGVPIAVKDNHDIAGQLTTHGTGAATTVARADGELVRRCAPGG